MDLRRLPSPDDLLVLLTVARLGRFTAVANALEITHTTVSRRILALDKQLGGRTLERTPQGWELTELGRAAVSAAESIEANLGTLAAGLHHGEQALAGVVRISAPDGFATYIATPALVKLQESYPLLRVELLSTTQRLRQNRSGVDIEVVAGAINSSRAETVFLAEYTLRLYAGAAYAVSHTMPSSAEQLQGHRLVSYVESSLQIAELSLAQEPTASRAAAFQASSIFAQIEAVRANAGIGMLPAFMADSLPGLVRVLPNSVSQKVQFWAAARPESLRSPAVQAVVASFVRELGQRSQQLVPDT